MIQAGTLLNQHYFLEGEIGRSGMEWYIVEQTSCGANSRQILSCICSRRCISTAYSGAARSQALSRPD